VTVQNNKLRPIPQNLVIKARSKNGKELKMFGRGLPFFLFFFLFFFSLFLFPLFLHCFHLLYRFSTT